MAYPHQEIIINNRTVFIEEILKRNVAIQSSFEKTTFDFISDWISGVQAFKQFTSGSTGTPKEVTLTRNQLKQSARRTLHALNLKSNKTALVCLDTKYIAGKMMLVRALEGNLKIIATEPTSNPLKNLPSDIQIDFTALVPLQLQEILNNKETSDILNTINKVIVGGAPISTSLDREIQNLKCETFATYGMTETVSHIALQKINGKEKSPYFKVLNEILISQDDRNCLIIEMPEFSEKIITNDLVELIDSNHFTGRGRCDNIINSGGYKVSPEKIENEIERIFEQQEIVKHFFISSIPDERLGQKIILILEGQQLSFEQGNTMLAQLKETFHLYEIPKEIHYINQIIITETGKINRR
jgi:O-succinylbenzoic acid--CoA ligase